MAGLGSGLYIKEGDPLAVALSALGKGTPEYHELIAQTALMIAVKHQVLAAKARQKRAADEVR